MFNVLLQFYFGMHTFIHIFNVYPKLIELCPPGGASLLVVDLPVMTFPLFWSAPLAYELEEMPTLAAEG